MLNAEALRMRPLVSVIVCFLKFLFILFLSFDKFLALLFKRFAIAARDGGAVVVMSRNGWRLLESGCWGGGNGSDGDIGELVLIVGIALGFTALVSTQNLAARGAYSARARSMRPQRHPRSPRRPLRQWNAPYFSPSSLYVLQRNHVHR